MTKPETPDYLRDAVSTKLQLASGRTEEQLEPVLGAIDSSTFVDEDGHIDQAKIDTFAATLGGTPHRSALSGGDDPVRDALARLTGDRNSSGSGSIASLREQARERINSGENAR